MKAHLNKIFKLQHSIHAIIHKLRITKQETTNVTPFEAHFARKCNTALSNLATISNSKNLNYRKVKYYLDEDTIPGRTYLSDEECADRECALTWELKRLLALQMPEPMNNNKGCKMRKPDTCGKRAFRDPSNGAKEVSKSN